MYKRQLLHLPCFIYHYKLTRQHVQNWDLHLATKILETSLSTIHYIEEEKREEIFRANLEILSTLIDVTSITRNEDLYELGPLIVGLSPRRLEALLPRDREEKQSLVIPGRILDMMGQEQLRVVFGRKGRKQMSKKNVSIPKK